MRSSNNRLLASLSTGDFDLLEPHLEAVTLGLRKNLERPNRRIDAVYFPEGGFASVIAVQSNGKQVEVGLIGRGYDGLAHSAGQSQLAACVLCSSARKWQCIPATELRKATQTSVSLRDSFLKFVQAFGVQTTHIAICNAQSRLDVRLARWLLMARDRIGDDTLPLTHEFLALMLGIRRPGVTEALHALGKRELISYGRGQIAVKNRKGMERMAEEAYGVPEANIVGSSGDAPAGDGWRPKDSRQ